MTTAETQNVGPKEVIYLLNKCIEVCIDSEKGYAVAAADVRDRVFKAAFLDKAQARSEFVVELQRTIAQIGALPENHGTAAGTVHRGWMGFRQAMEGRSDRLILEECARGEQQALAAYQHAVARTPLKSLPPEVSALLNNQIAAIELDLQQLRQQLNVH